MTKVLGDLFFSTSLTFKIPNTHPLLGDNISIRVIGVDTPEIKTKNKCEKELAIIAKGIVNSYMKKAKNISITNVKRGKYFRIVGDIIFDQKSLKEILLSRKLAYPYDGGTKKPPNWCKMLKAVKKAGL